MYEAMLTITCLIGIIGGIGILILAIKACPPSWMNKHRNGNRAEKL